MTGTPQKNQSQSGPQPAGNQPAENAVANGTPPDQPQGRRLQDDPRAQLALAKQNHAANPTAASGAAHIKAAHESSKQGKKEKKVRW